MYFRNLFVSVDQLGNALAGGNPDNTISARIGYYNHYSKNPTKTKWYWKGFQTIVDFTFRPVDGKGHCHEAFHNDAGEKFGAKTRNGGVAFLAIFIIASCMLIAIVLYTAWLLRLVSPKLIDRNENITRRLEDIKAKAVGAINEIEHHGLTPDTVLKELSKDTIGCAVKLDNMIEAKS